MRLLVSAVIYLEVSFDFKRDSGGEDECAGVNQRARVCSIIASTCGQPKQSGISFFLREYLLYFKHLAIALYW